MGITRELDKESLLMINNPTMLPPYLTLMSSIRTSYYIYMS